MKVSIITITYNRAHLIGETIRSVLDQTWPDFEHIIIDDGSTDNTEQVVKSFGDNRIKYFRYVHCGNLSVVHNRGFGHATGEIIALLDSDDIWVKNKLELAVKLFSDEAIVFITHNIRYFKNINEPGNPHYKYTTDLFGDFKQPAFTFRILPFPVLLFRKSLLADLHGMNETFHDGQQDFMLRAAASYPIYFIADCLAFIRLHDQNTHRAIKNLPYYTNFYKTALRLLLKKQVGFSLFSKGMYLNSRNLARHLFKS
jgi:glycosyltransferase involved in cell wall biosynthesis